MASDTASQPAKNSDSLADASMCRCLADWFCEVSGCFPAQAQVCQEQGGILFRPIFGSPQRSYTLYYDESNNHRKFYINSAHDSYNVDNDPSRKQVAATNFMLGGLAHHGESCTADPEALIASLRLQKSAKELKFDQVASGSFDLVLKSARVKQILRWILDSDLFVHYFSLNMEYWAFLDIVDDCIYHCVQKDRLRVPDEQAFAFINLQKDALYRLLVSDKTRFLATMRRFNFPAIEGREREFIRALLELSQSRIEELRSSAGPSDDELESVLAFSQLLTACGDIDDMGMTVNDEAGALIDGLSVFYQNRGQLFANSTHVFDDEFSVDDDLAELHEADTSLQFRHRFVNSLNSPLTQISDVVAGLFAKYFECIERNSVDTLIAMRDAFNPFQTEALGLMRGVIDKSDQECQHFLHYVMPANSHRKHGIFMFPDEYMG
ncbi:hypothetical protein PQR33_22700 [Paraburkholderia sediminicola]|uniref:DUF3800 domain-containing protein n=1 Tax=Paraburkholderia sediminicola TaxID=458836 RepID=UPI0038B838B5